MDGQQEGTATPAATEPRKSMVGEVVVFTDQHAKEHLALVTADWSSPLTPREKACINVVIVSSDEGKTDTYGRQIERHTSVPAKNEWSAPGFFWTEVSD